MASKKVLHLSQTHTHTSNDRMSVYVCDSDIVIVLANYVFDTLQHDLFSVKAHTLYEGTVKLNVDAMGMYVCMFRVYVCVYMYGVYEYMSV